MITSESVGRFEGCRAHAEDPRKALLYLDTPWDCHICRPIDPQNHPNVGMYGIHGVSGINIIVCFVTMVSSENECTRISRSIQKSHVSLVLFNVPNMAKSTH